MVIVQKYLGTQKGYFSINLQAASTVNSKFTNVFAQWLWSAHDSILFINSNLRVEFDINGYPNSIL